MPTKDTKQLYTEDETLAKLENALAQSSGEIKSDIGSAIKERKKELRSTPGVSSNGSR